MTDDEAPGHLDVFSGIGGFAIAAQWAGFHTVAFCEAERRCRAFLEKTWGRPVHPDIRELDGTAYRNIPILTGGPPCQPSSRAGDQRGAGDDRWLWPEALRVLEESEPDCVVFENPPGILDLDIDGILSEMGRLGYEVQPFDIPACAVDSPQLRHRIWFVGFRNVANTASEGRKRRDTKRAPDGRGAERVEGELADAGFVGSNKGGDSKPSGRESARPLAALDRLRWKDSVWMPCADGKVRRSPNDAVELVDGLHRSVLSAVGNAICPEGAYEILSRVKPLITQ